MQRVSLIFVQKLVYVQWAGFYTAKIRFLFSSATPNLIQRNTLQCNKVSFLDIESNRVANKAINVRKYLFSKFNQLHDPWKLLLLLLSENCKTTNISKYRKSWKSYVIAGKLFECRVWYLTIQIQLFDYSIICLPSKNKTVP